MKPMPVDGQAARSGVAQRRQVRALMRAHHPDLGGDPRVFVQILQDVDRVNASERLPLEVRFTKRRRAWIPTSLRLSRRRRPRRVV